MLAFYSIGIGTGKNVLQLGLPVLGGQAQEILLPGASAGGESGSLFLSQRDGWLTGGAVVPVADDLAAATAALYARIFAAIGDKRLVRCWNYVPTINQDDARGLEHYRAFCRGRCQAFETAHGTDFATLLPAASAVGGPAGSLAVIFSAATGDVSHVENPLQVPAYRYPQQYGPRAPSFSRATIVRTATDHCVFISGTAAIRGHATIAPGETNRQVECTLQNLAEISKACGLGADLARGRAAQRRFTIYLRHAPDYASVAQALDLALLQPGDTVTYVQADICRRDLTVEIEATVRMKE